MFDRKQCFKSQQEIKACAPFLWSPTLCRKQVRKEYAVLLLRNVLSSIRMTLMYSLNTGSSHNSFMQVLAKTA